VRASKSVYRVWLTWFLCGRTELFQSDELVSTRAFHTLQVWRNWREGTATNLIDETLRGSPVSDVMRCLHIGLLCVQGNVSGRPTMAAVVPMLNSQSWSLPSPSRPAFLLDSNADTGLPLLESDTGTTTQDQSTENTQRTAYLSPNWNFHRLRYTLKSTKTWLHCLKIDTISKDMMLHMVCWMVSDDHSDVNSPLIALC
jgi:hypothetical protein